MDNINTWTGLSIEESVYLMAFDYQELKSLLTYLPRILMIIIQQL